MKQAILKSYEKMFFLISPSEAATFIQMTLTHAAIKQFARCQREL